jgi:uncharacterized protein YegL
MPKYSGIELFRACLILAVLWMAASSHSDAQTAREPFAAVLVLDASGSMAGAGMDACKAGTHCFIDGMRPGDSAAVVSFSDTAFLQCPLTSDTGALHTGVNNISSRGATAMRDALLTATSYIRAAASGNRFIILVSDGADGSSTHGTAEIIATANNIRVRIITVALGNNTADFELEMIASLTGGSFYKVPTPAQLQPLLCSLPDSLTTGFTAPDTPSGFNLSVYPQPATDAFCVIVENASGSDVIITDLRGSDVLRYSSDNLNATDRRVVPAAMLPAGMYLVRARNGSASLVRRVLVVR